MLPLASNAMLVTVSSPEPPYPRAQSRLPEELVLVRKTSWPPALVRVVPPKVALAENQPAAKIFPKPSTATAWPPSLPVPPNLTAQELGGGVVPLEMVTE